MVLLGYAELEVFYLLTLARCGTFVMLPQHFLRVNVYVF